MTGLAFAANRRVEWLRVAAIGGAFALLLLAVVSGASPKIPAVLLLATTVVALRRSAVITWPHLMAALILIILFIPIRRYSLPVNLAVQLEPYRLFIILLVLGWIASLLGDPRMHLRRTRLEGPILVIVVGAIASLATNQARVAHVSSEVDKKLMFFVSFLVVLYLTSSAIRRLEDVDLLTKVLVGGGAVVAFFAIIEARTGFNVFNHVTRVLPFLRADDAATPEMKRFGSAKLRVFGSAQHPIALSALFVMLTPLAIYTWRRYRGKLWGLCALLIPAACIGTVSRTGIMMLFVCLLVFLWLRPREVRRAWPAVFPALVVIHFALPGTLGALKQSFLPSGGIVAEQQSMAGQSGSGRLADLGPALTEWRASPVVGEGFGTRVVDFSAPSGPTANILDDQWLGTLLETGIVGVLGWLWLFGRSVRKFGREAKNDDSPRGWLLASITAGIAAYAVGMLTYDAFSFIQVTFLLFIFIGLGVALTAAHPTAVPDAELRLPVRSTPADASMRV